jgi:lysophospholipase L1-like esterase
MIDGYPYARADSFPAVIERLTGWRVINAGISGQSSGEVLARFPRAMKQRPDAVMILCGTNDYIFGICGSGETLANITEMTRTAERGGAVPVIGFPILCDPQSAALSWAGITADEFAQANGELIKLRDKLKHYCDKNGVRYIDLQEWYKGIACYCDGLHPTRDGYRLIGEKAAEELASAEGRVK